MVTNVICLTFSGYRPVYQWKTLGIRTAAPLALSAFLASAAGTLGLQDDILANAVVPEDVHVANFRSAW